METVIESLLFKCGFDNAALKKGMQETDQTVSSGLKKIQSYFMPLLGATGLGALTAQFTNNAMSLGRFSDSLGINMQKFQAWSMAIERSGGSAEGFKSTIANLTNMINDVKMFGMSKMNPMFMRLGIGLKSDAMDMLPQIAKRFEGMSRAQSMNLGKQLGLDEGTIMLLQKGSAHVQEFVNKMKEKTLYTKRDAEMSVKFNNVMLDIKNSFMGVVAIGIRALLPVFTWMSEKLEKFINFIRKNERFVMAFFTLLASVIALKLLPALSAMFMASMRAMLPFVPWLILIMAIAAAWDDWNAYINGGNSALGKFWDIVKDYPDLFASIAGGIGAVALAMKVGFSLTNPMMLLFTALGAAIGLIVNNWDRVKEFFSSVGDWMGGLWDSFKGSEFEASMHANQNLMLAGGGGYPSSVSNTDTKTQIGQITVNTQATDAQGIARDINGAIANDSNKNFAYGANAGVMQK